MADEPGANLDAYVRYMVNNKMKKGRITLYVTFWQKVVDTCACPPKTDVHNLPSVAQKLFSIACELNLTYTTKIDGVITGGTHPPLEF